MIKPIKNVRVDGCQCTGHRLCLNEAPDVVGFDDALDRAFIKSEAEAFFVTQASAIYSAAAVCPMDAILINGRKVR